jgi:hypothetical protein
MIFESDGNTTVVSQENISLQKFILNFNEGYNKIKNDNLIINLFSFSDLTANDVMEFTQISTQHREAGKSFVLVTSKISYDELPDELNVVPTLQEAHDIIEMEEIERDLGI